MDEKCERFCSMFCVDGSCPIALSEEFPWYPDAPKSCDECHHNTGKCSDCIFDGSSECVKEGK